MSLPWSQTCKQIVRQMCQIFLDEGGEASRKSYSLSVRTGWVCKIRVQCFALKMGKVILVSLDLEDY